jgi:hypothetical protein
MALLLIHLYLDVLGFVGFLPNSQEAAKRREFKGFCDLFSLLDVGLVLCDASLLRSCFSGSGVRRRVVIAGELVLGSWCSHDGIPLIFP